MTKILYRGPLYRVIHSTEEEAECLADGWLPTPEDGKQYIVHTAIEAQPRRVPSMEEALAAGYSPMAAERVIAREKRLAAGLPEYEDQPIAVAQGEAPTTHFAPSNEAEKRVAPAAGFCPEPEQSSYVIPDELDAIRLVASAAEPLIALPKKKRPYPVKLAKPNDAEVKALG